MNRQFLRPLLLLVMAVLLLIGIGPFIPGWDNGVLPLKKFDWRSLFSTGEADVKIEDVQAAAESLAVNSQLLPLDAFVAKLESGSETNLRVAYFGDSIIEGDLISGTLRQQLQARYGGSGVGLMPITSIVNEFRKTIRHTFSRNWETVSFMSGPQSTELGIIGYTFIPRNYQLRESKIEKPATPKDIPDQLATELDSLGNPMPKVTEKPVEKPAARTYVSGPAWVEYSAASVPGGSSDFRRIRLFYSKAQSSSKVMVSHDGAPKQEYTLSAGDGLQVLDISAAAPVKKVRLEFDSRDPIHVYGVSFDDYKGAYVDNLSVRGFSGMYMHRVPKGHFNVFQGALGYDLIIMQYGENVSRPEHTNYDSYRQGMIASVKSVQAGMPGVPVLLISAHDRSVKRGGTYQTSPDIPILVNAQSDMAKTTGSAFWNLFEAMGGLDSMKSFVHASPPLASKDYTHFNAAGASKIAMMLLDVITQGSRYKQQ
jgi:hypothetical protein